MYPTEVTYEPNGTENKGRNVFLTKEEFLAGWISGKYIHFKIQLKFVIELEQVKDCANLVNSI